MLASLMLSVLSPASWADQLSDYTKPRVKTESTCAQKGVSGTAKGHAECCHGT